MIEGRNREIGKTKIWRLTKFGREELGVDSHPVVFQSLSTDHRLAIGDVWVKLRSIGGLSIFDFEPREEYAIYGKQKKYCPDAFLGFRKHAFVLEVQLSALSTLQWGKKWVSAVEYFDGGHYKSASWQKYSKNIIKPSMVVLSKQSPEVVRGNTRLPLIILRDILDLTSQIHP